MWGAAISAYSVEGGAYDSDWTRWEQRPGRIAEAQRAARACAHYDRFEEDIRLAHKLGHTAFFVALEWSRVEPREGSFSQEALDHYGHVAACARQAGMIPVAVLQHVALPRWFAENYGWQHPAAARRFLRYTERTLGVLMAHCTWWIPLFEPMEWLTRCWLEGRWPPGHSNAKNAWRALHQIAKAQAGAHRLIHSFLPGAMVGLSIRGRGLRPFEPENPWDLRAARREYAWRHRWLPRAIAKGRWPWGKCPALAGSADFIALGFDGLCTTRFSPRKPHRLFTQPCTPQGQPLKSPVAFSSPKDFRAILVETAGYGLPLVITGAGLPTEEDVERCRYLLGHTHAVGCALQGGIDVRGYFHRSLLDGFEYDHGFTRRYGLVHVNRDTLDRTPNPSAYLLKDIAGAMGIKAGAVARYCPGWEPEKEDEP